MDERPASGKVSLHVICKECGREFDTKLRMDRRSFERGTLAANYHTCPHCGVQKTYSKSDYILRGAD
ncbi:MAG: hypothetical protein QN198_09570 [Armatimonadota bacterium]|nr:hypothetical protein [Armatimonadota bacterium]MDR5703836.1 hypothetical protein [Armatimonadota bacterium]MDR7434227.1 hypothetical protein [Armatimonadota bacterium]